MSYICTPMESHPWVNLETLPFSFNIFLFKYIDLVLVPSHIKGAFRSMQFSAGLRGVNIASSHLISSHLKKGSSSQINFLINQSNFLIKFLKKKHTHTHICKAHA